MTNLGLNYWAILAIRIGFAVILLSLASCSHQAHNENVILVGGGKDWYAFASENSQLFCQPSSELCSNRIIVVFAERDLRRIYVNGRIVWDGKIVLGNYIGKCGNISQIDSIEYYRTSDPDRRGGVHWGIDIYFRISVHSGRSNDGALLEIDLGEAKIIGSCVELD